MTAIECESDERQFIEDHSYIILSDDGSPMISFSFLGDHSAFTVTDDDPSDLKIRRAINFEAWLRGFKEVEARL